MRTFGLLCVILPSILLAPARAQDAGKPVNLEKLNTEADEEDPCPTPDHLGLLYAVKRASYDIYVSKRTTLTTPFGPGKTFIADKLADERSPFMHKDRYYFATNEVPDKKFDKFKNFDVMMQIGFQAPLHVSGDVNSKDDEMYPWVTPAGRELYFSRKTEKGWKLFVANGPTPGPIGKSKDVGFDAGFHRAAIGGNGLTMYLQGPLEKDKLGIFRSKRAKVGDPWSKPEPVKSLNHEESKKGDMQPAVTFDGARLYFVSDRPGGKGGLDVWFVSTASMK